MIDRLYHHAQRPDAGLLDARLRLFVLAPNQREPAHVQEDE